MAGVALSAMGFTSTGTTFLDYIPQYIITWQQKCRIKAELRCTHTRVDSHV
jgi:hypothetical protein